MGRGRRGRRTPGRERNRADRELLHLLVHPLELGFLSLGLLGSLLVAHRIAERDYPVRTARAFAPWAGLFLLLTAAALWLLYQPMEMRGAMILGG